MPSDAWRVDLLVEDRLTERFLRGLLRRYKIHLREAFIAPNGKGSAASWVLKNYPTRAKRLRSKNFQRMLGLLVVIDGDNLGVAARKLELEQERTQQGLVGRTPDDPIAILVPTWSIETWLAELCGRHPIAETAPLKHDPELRALWDGQCAATTIGSAVAAWRGAESALPSLTDAYGEAERFGM